MGSANEIALAAILTPTRETWLRVRVCTDVIHAQMWFMKFNSYWSRILALHSEHEGSPSVSCLPVDQETTRLMGDFLLLISMLWIFSTLTLLAGWQKWHPAVKHLCHLSSKVFVQNKLRKSEGQANPGLPGKQLVKGGQQYVFLCAFSPVVGWEVVSNL